MALLQTSTSEKIKESIANWTQFFLQNFTNISYEIVERGSKQTTHNYFWNTTEVHAVNLLCQIAKTLEQFYFLYCFTGKCCRLNIVKAQIIILNS